VEAASQDGRLHSLGLGISSATTCPPGQRCLVHTVSPSSDDDTPFLESPIFWLICVGAGEIYLVVLAVLIRRRYKRWKRTKQERARHAKLWEHKPRRQEQPRQHEKELALVSASDREEQDEPLRLPSPLVSLQDDEPLTVFTPFGVDTPRETHTARSMTLNDPKAYYMDKRRLKTTRAGDAVEPEVSSELGFLTPRTPRRGHDTARTPRHVAASFSTDDARAVWQGDDDEGEESMRRQRRRRRKHKKRRQRKEEREERRRASSLSPPEYYVSPRTASDGSSYPTPRTPRGLPTLQTLARMIPVAMEMSPDILHSPEADMFLQSHLNGTTAAMSPRDDPSLLRPPVAPLPFVASPAHAFPPAQVQAQAQPQALNL